MSDLPLGMKVKPFGWPLMSHDFFCCVIWAIGDKEIINKFKNETGVDLNKIIPNSNLDKLILEATGIQKDYLGNFADWVATEIWGTNYD